jgi:transcriptional regulator with XRE-family HTH domain
VRQPELTYSERFSERLRAELLQLAVREGKPVGWAELGRRVRERTGRDVTDASVNRWGSGSVPDLETIAALAAILGVRAGYLAFGEGEREATPLSSRATDAQVALDRNDAARTAEAARVRRAARRKPG